MGGPELKEEDVKLGARPGGWERRAETTDSVLVMVRPRLRHCPAQTETEWQQETRGKRSKEAAWVSDRQRGVRGNRLGNGRRGAEGLSGSDGQAGGSPQLRGSEQASGTSI